MSAFSDAFCERVRAARKARGLTQAVMAAALGVGAKAYEKYEARSPLPHCLVERFAAIAGVDIEYLFTGRRPRALPASPPKAPPDPPQAREFLPNRFTQEQR